ncbi:MAG: hypothetical protein ABI759_29080 [Candidatus Solibacter sp.]
MDGKRGDGGEKTLRGSGFGGQSLEGFNARQLEHAGLRGNGAGYFDSLFQRAHAGTPSGASHLQKHGQWAGEARGAQHSAEVLDAGDAIDEAIHFEPRIALHDGGHGVHVGAAGKLIGDKDSLDPVLDGREDLRRMRERDGPGSRIELTTEELGAHGGLAVGREQVAAGRTPLRHGGDIVRQGGLFE